MSSNTDYYTDWQVVMNTEEQYSIWPMAKSIPMGWSSVNVSGTKKECLDYIDSTWVDMRPLSLRKEMESKSITTKS